MTHSAQITYSAALAAAAAAPVQQAADWISEHGTVTIPTGARSSMTIRNCAERLATFAETVRKQWALFGGGPKPAAIACKWIGRPRRPTPRSRPPRPKA